VFWTNLDNVRQGFNLLFTPVIYYGVVASLALQLATLELAEGRPDRIRFRISMQIRQIASTSLSVNYLKVLFLGKALLSK
jgi:hypothetical protein